MSVPARLLAFVAVLGLTFGGGWAIGAAVGPFDDTSPATQHAPQHPATTTTEPSHTSTAHATSTTAPGSTRTHAGPHGGA